MHSSLRHRLLTLVLPALAYQYLLLVIQHCDQYMGWPFSAEHKAALNTANYLYWLVSCYSVIVAAGGFDVVHVISFHRFPETVRPGSS